jgi:hypothetical protein
MSCRIDAKLVLVLGRCIAMERCAKLTGSIGRCDIELTLQTIDKPWSSSAMIQSALAGEDCPEPNLRSMLLRHPGIHAPQHTSLDKRLRCNVFSKVRNLRSPVCTQNCCSLCEHHKSSLTRPIKALRSSFVCQFLRLLETFGLH